LVVWSLIKSFQQRTFLWVSFVGTAAVAFAIFFILWQYASYLGWPQVLGYWQSRFAERSTETPGMGYKNIGEIFVRFLVAGYGPLLILLLITLFVPRQKMQVHLKWVFTVIAGVLVYNLVFLNWSLEHEFAWLALSLVLCVSISFLFSQHFATKKLMLFTLVYAAFGIAIYFYVNRPGPISRDGTRYDSAMMMGQTISNQVSKEAFIFTNLPNAKIEEYYALRTFNLVSGIQRAKVIADSLHLPKAYWLSVENGDDLNIQLLQ
jgi:hypothetical protein